MWRGKKMVTPCGLCVPNNDNKRVPLKAISVSATLQGFVCNVTSTLTYENTESNAVEAVFVFPLDDDSAVYQFEAEIDDRKVIAECQDYEQAKETYDDAMTQGYTSVLLRQDPESADVFECSVGNLPPHKSATIVFSYVRELPLLVDGGVNFVLPTLLNPRFNPATEDGGAPDSLLNNSRSVTPNAVPYTFSFTAQIAGDRVLNNIKSDHDDIHIDYFVDKTAADLSLKKVFVPDHDLSFVLYYDNPYKPSAILGKGDAQKDGMLKNDVLMLNFFPELSDSDFQNEREFVFIVDRSGSMGGPRIRKAKESLLLFLKSLPTDCYFNIVSFGSRHQMLFPNGSEKYSEESLQRATELQNYMEADFGGTEILRPLKEVFGMKPIEGYPRQVFVLTDGAVGNVTHVIAEAKNNAAKARVFTMGIGEGASTALVKGLARAGGGKAMFVTDEERLQPKVMRMLKSAMQVGVTDINVQFQSPPQNGVLVLPDPLPPLYSGDRLVLYAVLKGEAKPDFMNSSVSLNGKVGGNNLCYNIPLSDAKVNDSSSDMAIQRLAAKSQIAFLQEVPSNKAMVITLSMSANIMSRYTSMVGVDTVKGDTKGAKTRRIPTPAQVHYGGHVVRASARIGPPMMNAPTMCASPDTKAMCAAPPPMAKCAASPPSMAMGAAPPPMAWSTQSGPPQGRHMSAAAPLPSRGGAERGLMNQKKSSAMECDTPLSSAVPSTGYMRIVELQKFTGEWRLDQMLCDALEMALDAVQKAKPDEVDDSAWASILAVCFLQTKYMQEYEEWEMVETKAMAWITKNTKQSTQLINQAKQLIK